MRCSSCSHATRCSHVCDEGFRLAIIAVSPDTAMAGPVTWKRGYSSAGRALAWHARGQRFDPAYLHHQAVPYNAVDVDGSTPSPSSRGLGHHPFTVITGVRIP